MFLKIVLFCMSLVIVTPMASGCTRVPYEYCKTMLRNGSDLPGPPVTTHPFLMKRENIRFVYLKDIESLCQIECDVPRNETLDFKKIRDWMESVSLDTKFLFIVRCGMNNADLPADLSGNISMSYPVDVPRLVGVDIQECPMTDYWRSHDDVKNPTKSELRVYRLNFVKISNNNLPKHIYGCDPETLRHKDIQLTNKVEIGTSQYEENLVKCPETQSDSIFYRFEGVKGFQWIKTKILAENKKLKKLRMLEFLNVPDITELPLDFLKLFSVGNGYREDLVIQIKGNKINRLSRELLENYAKEKIPRLRIWNPEYTIKCDCAMSDAIQYMNATENRLRLLRGQPNSTAIGPYNMKCSDQKTLLREAVVECKTKTKDQLELILAGILSTLVMLILTIAILLKYQNVIHVLIYTRFKIKIFANVDVHSKIYDAFVAYNNCNEKWVTGILMPKLETQQSHFRLCLHGRDFEVGEAIADNIIKSVENSRHTIMILSQSFVKSEWCLMEFRTAYHKSLKEGSRRLITVVMNDISDDDISKMDADLADLRSHLQSTTYLSTNDRWFWDKLIYALSTTSSVNPNIIQSEEMDVLLVAEEITTV